MTIDFNLSRGAAEMNRDLDRSILINQSYRLIRILDARDRITKLIRRVNLS